SDHVAGITGHRQPLVLAIKAHIIRLWRSGDRFSFATRRQVQQGYRTLRSTGAKKPAVRTEPECPPMDRQRHVELDLASIEIPNEELGSLRTVLGRQIPAIRTEPQIPNGGTPRSGQREEYLVVDAATDNDSSLVVGNGIALERVVKAGGRGRLQ